MSKETLKNELGGMLLMWQRFHRPILHKHGVTPADKRILYGLGGVESISKNDLAKKVVLENSSLTRSIDRLEKKAMIKKVIDVDDKRFVSLCLTRKGERKLQLLKHSSQQVFDQACKVVSKKDLRTAEQVIQKIAAELNKIIEEDK